MLSWIVGSVDVSAAAVLIAAFAGIAIITTAFIAKYQRRDDAEREFELAKLRIEKESKKEMFQVETDRVFRVKQLEQNLITSHRAEG